MNKQGLWKKIVLCLIVLALLISGAVWWGYSHLTSIVEARLRGFVGNDLTIGSVTARWNRVELEQVRIARRGTGPFERRIAIGRVVLRPRFVSLFSGSLEMGDISLENPYLLLEIAPDGSLVRLFPQAAAESRQKAASPAPALPVIVNAVHITGGTIEVLDWHAARRGGVGVSNPRERYHLLRLQNIKLDLGKLDIPSADRAMPLRLSLKSQGGGELTLAGTLSPKSLESRLRLDISGLDITRFRPYFLKQGDLDVKRGTLAAACDISIRNRQLKAPGTISLKGLEFEHKGTKGAMMGIPARALVSLMSDSKDELKVNFNVSGSLDNPRFTIRQSLMDQIATALSSKLGVSTVTSVGKGIVEIGEKGVKGLMGIFGGK